MKLNDVLHELEQLANQEVKQTKARFAITDDIRQFFPIIKREASDDRRYVMKGVNWALRQIGKRNVDLYNEAIAVAHQIMAIGSKPARWIATDALRQLQSPKVFLKNYPRALYGK